MSKNAKKVRWGSEGSGLSWLKWLMGAGILFVLVFGALVSAWSVSSKDGRMRDDLKNKVKIAANAISPESIKALSGDITDKNKDDYILLKQRLSDLKNIVPEYRFFYIMGQRKTGEIYIMVDAEPSQSKSFSYPGQEYTEASEELKGVFSGGETIAEGPVEDRWGNWISGISPIFDNDTDDVIAVLGIDRDAAEWRREVLSSLRMPLFVTALISLVILGLMLYVSKIEESERKYHLLANNIADTVWVTDMNLKRLYTSPAVERLTGFTPEEINLMSPEELFTEESLRKALTVFAEELEREESGDADPDRYRVLEVERKRKDGTTVWTDSKVRFLRDKKGKAVAILGVADDISERKRAQQELAFQLEFQKALAEISARFLRISHDEIDDAIDMALLKVLRVMNADRCYIFRYSEDGNAMNNTNEICAEGIEPFKEKTQNISLEKHSWWKSKIEGSGFVYIEDTDTLPEEAHAFREIAKEHGIKTILSIQTIEYGKVNGFIGIDYVKEKRAFTKDEITLLSVVGEIISGAYQRHKTESAQRESEERFRSLVSNVPGAIFRCLRDDERTILFISDAVKAMTGYPASDFVGNSVRAFAEIMNDEDRMIAEKTIEESLSEKKHYAVRYRILHANGESRWFRENASGVFDENGKLLYIDGVIIDITDRMKDRDELNKFKTISDLANYGIAISDSHGILEYVNDYFASVHGYAPEELIGEHLSVFHTEEQMEKVNFINERLFREGGFSNEEVWHIGRNMEPFPMLMTGLALKDDLGNVANIAVSAADITDLIRGNIELKEKTEELEGFFNVALDLLCIADVEGRFIKVNKQWEEVLGYSTEELEKRNFLEFVHPEDIPATLDAMSDLDKQNVVLDFVNRYKSKDGSYRYIEWRSHPSKKLIYAAARDITERKKNEDALRESEEKYKFISENVEDVIWIMNLDLKTVYVSPSVERTLGFSVEERLAQEVQDQLAPESLSTAEKYLRKELEAEERGDLDAKRVRVLELEFYHKDGSTRWLESIISGIRDNEDRLTGLYGVSRDITERKKMEDELREANKHLEEAHARANNLATQAEMANAAKSEFLANMSHEIRTPMNAVIGMTELLLETKLSEEQRLYAETVSISGNALLSLINDILDFSKIEAGKLELEQINFDLLELMEEVVEIVASSAQQKNIELVFHMENTVYTAVRGDPARLRQIILNLCNNAIKFTESGEVEINVSRDSESGIYEKVRFNVRDTGIGIPQNKVDGLFDLFRQVDASTTRKFGGSGLGLAIAKKLCLMMNGEIGVESVEGEGSLFWFTVVLQKQTEKQGSADKACAEIEGTKVLVLDDNATNRFVLCKHLESWNMKCAEASNADYAMEVLIEASRKGEPFALVLTDMQMPETDGEEFGIRVKENPEIRDTVLVMMTSMGKGFETQRLKSLGFASVLTKPIKKSYLLQCIAEALRETQTPIGAVPESKAASIPADSAETIKALVVEDNMMNQMVTMKFLEKLGVSADTALNGKEALSALEDKDYDIIFMDIQMPEMDGYEASKRIRESEKATGKHVPIVALTAHALKGEDENCFRAGMDAYISKPVKKNDLLEAIRTHVTKTGDRIAPRVRSEKTSAVSDSLMDIEGFMRIVSNDENLAKETVSMFLELYPEIYAKLERSIEEGDLKNAEFFAHRIKGSISILNARHACELAEKIEFLARKGDIESMRADLLEFKSALDELDAFLCDEGWKNVR